MLGMENSINILCVYTLLSVLYIFCECIEVLFKLQEQSRHRRVLTVVVQWGNCVSAPVTVRSGVHQRGFLSPHLFNAFLDNVSNVLQNSLYRCYISGESFNHVIWADGTLSLDPSPTTFQNVLFSVFYNSQISHQL